MAVNEIHDGLTTQKQSMLVNDIHSPVMIFTMHLTRVTLTEWLDKDLRLSWSANSEHFTPNFGTSTYT